MLRPPTTDDQQSILEVIHACSRKMTASEEMTLEDLISDWQSPGFDPQADLRVVTSLEGGILGYIEVWIIDSTPFHPRLWARVHPDYEGQGIGTALMDWGEIRAQEAIDRVPKDARVSIYSGTVSTYQPAKDLLEGLNMTMIRHSFRMHIELEQLPPEPLWADGIILKPFDGSDEQLKAIYLADDEAFQDHFGYVEEPFEAGYERFKHAMVEDDAFDPELFFIAMDGMEIAGVSLCRSCAWDDKDVGWIRSLGVRRPWRKRGIGLALLIHTFRSFWDRGKTKIALGVDAESLTGALRLYEKAGMHVQRQFDLYEKELRPGKELSKITLED